MSSAFSPVATSARTASSSGPKCATAFPRRLFHTLRFLLLFSRQIIYNVSTKQYVMYMHIDSSNYGEAKVGVATSSSVCGSYTYRGSFQPLGHQRATWVYTKTPMAQRISSPRT
jgi:hypothetical protein